MGQIFWGTVSDHRGRKWSLGILAVGWAATVLLMIFISSGALGWIILIGWGIFRNSPFPVMYASIIVHISMIRETSAGQESSVPQGT